MNNTSVLDELERESETSQQSNRVDRREAQRARNRLSEREIQASEAEDRRSYESNKTTVIVLDDSIGARCMRARGLDAGGYDLVNAEVFEIDDNLILPRSGYYDNRRRLLQDEYYNEQRRYYNNGYYGMGLGVLGLGLGVGLLGAGLARI